MKKLIYMLLALAGLFLNSCTDEVIPPADETDGLIQIQEITNDTQTIELYTENGKLEAGYNRIYFRIRDLASGDLVNPEMVMWMPMMDMSMMDHSCPYTQPEKVAGKDHLYAGYAVFQMPGNTSEGWNLTFTYQLGSQAHTAKGNIDVTNPARKRVTVVTGSDSKKYILALIEPAAPIVGLNDIVVGLYTMQDMMTFPAVADHAILIDPRMPSMGNHGSPNNADLVYNATDGLYHGTLSLTMTGYWKINLILKDPADNILEGEAVTETVESSSLYLEVEF